MAVALKTMGKVAGGSCALLVWMALVSAGLLSSGGPQAVTADASIGGPPSTLAESARRLYADTSSSGSQVNVTQLIFALIISWACAAVYYCMYIRPTHEKYLPLHAVVPEKLKGSFKYDLFGCTDDGSSCKTCLCFYCCAPCAITDLWYRAGHLTSILGSEAKGCPGWQWLCGLCCHCMLSVGCFLPSCWMGYLRHGECNDKMAAKPAGACGIVAHRDRFAIPSDGCSSLVGDCCTWFWCGPCAGTQEYRQVMDVINATPVQGAPPMVDIDGATGVVGRPVQVEKAV